MVEETLNHRGAENPETTQRIPAYEDFITVTHTSALILFHLCVVDTCINRVQQFFNPKDKPKSFERSTGVKCLRMKVQ